MATNLNKSYPIVTGPVKLGGTLSRSSSPRPVTTSRPVNGRYTGVAVNASEDQTVVINGKPMVRTGNGGYAPGGPIVPYSSISEYSPRGQSDFNTQEMQSYFASQANAYANATDATANIAPTSTGTTINWGAILLWGGIALVAWLIISHLLKGGHR